MTPRCRPVRRLGRQERLMSIRLVQCGVDLGQQPPTPPRGCARARRRYSLSTDLQVRAAPKSRTELTSRAFGHIDDYMTQPTDLRLPRYQRLRDEIAARVNRQEWRPGDIIPSETELSSLYGVAIGTVRKAIDQLVSEGVLERQQGRGTFVRRARFNSSLFRFFRFQSEQGERRIPQSRILRRKSAPATQAVASALRIPVGEPVINLSRLRLIDDVPLLAEEIWLQKSRFEAVLEVETADFGDLLYPLYEERCGQV